MEHLKEYVEKLESADMTAAFCIDGEEEAEVRGVTFDSKEVVSGGIFVCKGKNFRVEYLKEALERGCICYVSEKRYELSEETAWIQVKDIRKAMPVLAAIFYRTEPLPLHLTGVTGTKGKTTTSYYIKAILDVWEKKQPFFSGYLRRKRSGTVEDDFAGGYGNPPTYPEVCGREHPLSDDGGLQPGAEI